MALQTMWIRKIVSGRAHHRAGRILGGIAVTLGVLAGLPASASAAPEQDMYYTLQAQHSGYCLDVAGASRDDGAHVIQWGCHRGFNQQFRFIPVSLSTPDIFWIEARHSEKVLDVEWNSTRDRASIVQFSRHGGSNQKFRVQETGGGIYRLIALHSDKCVAIAGANLSIGEWAIQWPCVMPGGREQQFLLEPAGVVPR